VSPFEAMVAVELRGLLRAGATPRAVRLTVRELVVERLVRGPLDAREINDTVEAMVRAACALVSELNTSEDLIDIVCGASLEAVRGHGGESARWLAAAIDATSAALEQARDHAGEHAWRWVPGRVPRW
jgi:hypothetical protein